MKFTEKQPNIYISEILTRYIYNCCKQSLYALNQCYNMFCVVLIAKPKCNFQVSIKIQILVIENFCVYYCVCIEGIFKHQGH